MAKQILSEGMKVNPGFKKNREELGKSQNIHLFIQKESFYYSDLSESNN